MPLTVLLLASRSGSRSPPACWCSLPAATTQRAAAARARAGRRASLGFLVTIPLWTGFDRATRGMQFVELRAWIPRFNINYHLGVDGISMLFILLNSFITPLVVIAGWTVIETRVGAVHGARS